MDAIVRQPFPLLHEKATLARRRTPSVGVSARADQCGIFTQREPRRDGQERVARAPGASRGDERSYARGK